MQRRNMATECAPPRSVDPVFYAYEANVCQRVFDLHATAQGGGPFAAAIELMASGVRAGGVMQSFGSGHSFGFAMEISGRAGGLIPSHAFRIEDLVLLGGYDVSVLADGTFERDPRIADDLWELYDIQPADVFLIASNSGANGSVVGVALRAKQEGHPVIAVTSLEHSRGVTSKHPSGKRLFELADVVIDNLAPFGDCAVQMGDGPKMGPVSSITSAFIAQLLTLGTAQRISQQGQRPQVYLSANIPGGDEHNNALQARYGRRINSYLR